MRNKAAIEILVGVLLVIAFLALAFLALRVSGLAVNGGLFGDNSYKVRVDFPSIGSLKVRAPVRIAGVEIGTVSSINLNDNFFAEVTLKINGKIKDIPSDTTASITAAGLLGDDYVSLSPGYAATSLHNGSQLPPGHGATNILSLLSTFTSKSKDQSNTKPASANS